MQILLDILFFFFVVLIIIKVVTCLVTISAKMIFFNPFVPNAAFLYPLKTSENLDVFRGSRKGAMGTNELKSHKTFIVTRTTD